MKTSFLKNTALMAALLAGLAFTSCKDKEADTTDTDMDTTTMDTEMESTDSLDETGAKDTISITTDTITTVKP